MPARRDLTGWSPPGSRLTARHPARVGGRAGWLCDCACGTRGHPVTTHHLRAGRVRSCGCLRAEVSGERAVVATGVCERCGAALAGRTSAAGERKYCSEFCERAAGSLRRLGPVPVRSCAECGGTFAPAQRKAKAKYCSVRCKDRANDRAKAERRARAAAERIGRELEDRIRDD